MTDHFLLGELIVGRRGCGGLLGPVEQPRVWLIGEPDTLQARYEVAEPSQVPDAQNRLDTDKQRPIRCKIY